MEPAVRIRTSHATFGQVTPALGLDRPKLNSPVAVPDRDRLRVPLSASEFSPICLHRGGKKDPWEVKRKVDRKVFTDVEYQSKIGVVKC